MMKLVRQAQRFKDWMKGQQDSDDLVDAYCREVSHLDWADKLPPKTVRWLVISAVGLALNTLTGPHAAAAGGLALSVADTFLLDKVIKGWRPNQFIEGPLKKFLRLK